jgi:glucose-6-phosphate isomerase
MQWQIDALAQTDNRCDAQTRHVLENAWNEMKHGALVTGLAGIADLTQARSVARRFRECSERTVVIGTGGASLGAQALVAAAPEPERLVFLDNIDPTTTTRVIEGADLARTSWIIASKSGATVETLATTLALLDVMHESGAHAELSSHVIVITGATDSPLRALATAHGIPILTHPDIGGRYSVFTLVGLLPALIAGMDAERIRSGASFWCDAMSGDTASELYDSVWWLVNSRSHYPIHVVMAYGDHVRAYTRWFQQLWAESLGKQAQGSTPYAAIGTIDQHSQLQLFLDGPRDKSFTLVLPNYQGKGRALSDGNNPALAYLKGHTIGDVMHASAEGTAATLAHHHVPLRVLRTAQLNDEAMGELLMRHMAETVLAAALMDVNPYDQPAVEEGKKRTRSLLDSSSFRS